jgi:hypothetical protein
MLIAIGDCLRDPATSVKWKSVRIPHAILWDTPVDLTGVPNWNQMLQGPMELSIVLSDSERAFSGAPESSCSYGGAFKMLQDLTYRIVKFCCSWDSVSSLNPLCSSGGDLPPDLSQLWLLGFHHHKSFRVSE